MLLFLFLLLRSRRRKKFPPLSTVLFPLLLLLPPLLVPLLPRRSRKNSLRKILLILAKKLTKCTKFTCFFYFQYHAPLRLPPPFSPLSSLEDSSSVSLSSSSEEVSVANLYVCAWRRYILQKVLLFMLRAYHKAVELHLVLLRALVVDADLLQLLLLLRIWVHVEHSCCGDALRRSDRVAGETPRVPGHRLGHVLTWEMASSINGGESEIPYLRHHVYLHEVLEGATGVWIRVLVVLGQVVVGGRREGQGGNLLLFLL